MNKGTNLAKNMSIDTLTLRTLLHKPSPNPLYPSLINDKCILKSFS